jgi:pantoate--beta-alanine ligase
MMYPREFATTVSVAGPLTETLEGAHRGREHFDGVTTVVTKLLLAISPHVAWFGAKDAQQVLVVKRLVYDLGIPVEICVGDTVRETDGLAMSSRNVRLTAPDRVRAGAISGALRTIQAAITNGADAAAALDAGRAELADSGIEPEYLCLANPRTLEPVLAVNRTVLALIAAYVGPVRLIDNLTIRPPRPGARP